MSSEAEPQLGAPWFGVRKFARKLIAETRTLRTERDAAKSQLERIAAMGRELVAEVRDLRSKLDVTTQQLHELGAL